MLNKISYEMTHDKEEEPIWYKGMGRKEMEYDSFPCLVVTKEWEYPFSREC